MTLTPSRWARCCRQTSRTVDAPVAAMDARSRTSSDGLHRSGPPTQRHTLMRLHSVSALLSLPYTFCDLSVPVSTHETTVILLLL